MSRRAFIASLIVLIPAAAIGAQKPEQVPRELAIEMSRPYGPGTQTSADPLIFVGTVAPTVGDRIPFPPGTRIYGSTIQNAATDVFAETPLSPEALRRWWSEELPRRGWKATQSEYVARTGGFQPPPPAYPSDYCSDIGQVTIGTALTNDGATRVRLRVSKFAYQCTAPAQAAGRSQTTVQTQPVTPTTPRLPILYDPPDALRGMECMRSRGSSTQQQYLVSTSPADLLSHYARQLEGEGWLPIPSPVAPAARSWQRVDSTGTVSTTTLIIAGTGIGNGGCRELHLSVGSEVRR